MRLKTAATVSDYRALAQKRLPPFLFHYIDGAAGTEITAARNVREMEAVTLRQRIMVDVEGISTATTLFGQTLSMPVILGPVGLAGLFARRGELQAIRAARSAGIPFCLSSLGICSLGEVEGELGGPAPWFQLYMIRDRAFMRDLLSKAQMAEAPVLVFTVDVAVSGIRHRDRRSGLTGSLAGQAWQAARRPRWTVDVAMRGGPLLFGNIAAALPEARSLGDFWGWLARNFDPCVTWDDLAFVREHWRGPIVVKGVMDPADAIAAVAAGADGVIVSNHGGRQLDGVRATVQALPAVVDAVSGSVPVLVDGGVRSGIDIVRALALGADACLLGRAWAYALAAGGAVGVTQLIEDLRRELANTLALTGCRTVRAAGRHLLDTGSGDQGMSTSTSGPNT